MTLKIVRRKFAVYRHFSQDSTLTFFFCVSIDFDFNSLGECASKSFVKKRESPIERQTESVMIAVDIALTRGIKIEVATLQNVRRGHSTVHLTKTNYRK